MSDSIADHVVKQIFKPNNLEAYAPYVKIWFNDVGSPENPLITVGNDSCPNCDEKNTAVIKTFEYGWSDGSTVKIEILDQEGGSFEKIAEHIFKDMNKASKAFCMSIEFGWIVKGCDGTSLKSSSPPNLMFMVTNVEVHFSKGAVHYTISGNDLMQAVFATRSKKSYGTASNRIALKEALKQMFEDEEPKIKFRRAKRKGTNMMWDDEAYDWKNAKGAWTADGQNKLAIAMKWTENFRTTNDRGTTPFWVTGEKEATIAFLEDGLPDWEATPESMLIDNNVGTFLVNGGAGSNVIDFVPKISWPAAMAARLASGGEPGSVVSGKALEKTNKKSGGTMQTKDTGLLTSVSPTSQVADSVGFAESAKEQSKNQDLNAKASGASIPLGMGGIEAELRIQGDPREDFCIFMKSVTRFCSVVVINPFHLRNQPTGGCSDWLAKPTINSVLTNRGWQIKSINHSIREGSYVTTFQLFLAVPGVDIGANKPAGGDNKANTKWTQK